MSSSANRNGLAKVFKSMLHLPSYSRWQQQGTQHTLSALIADLKQDWQGFGSVAAHWRLARLMLAHGLLLGD